MEKHPLHLKNPELQTSPEVNRAVEREERRTDEKVPNDPVERIEAYMDRLENIFLNPDKQKRERNLEMFRDKIYDALIIKPEDVPEQAFLLEQKIAREMGYGDVEITDGFKDKKIQQIVNDQKHSLDRWMRYLTSDDATYPTWSKYLVFTSITKMGGLKKGVDESGKEKAIFKKRNKETVASFPPLNARALAMTVSALSEQLRRDGIKIENTSTKLDDAEFKKLISSENFSKIYAQFLIELPEYSTEGLKEIRGEWVKYEKNSDPERLVKSLDGYPLEWCTANPDTARSHLEGGDFYVYYSLDQDGNAVIPRLAIRMQDDEIAEDPRGIAPDQNLDPYITPVLEEKLKDFGEKGEQYKKKSEDMKKLTALDKKHEQGEEFTREDLVFLYEIDGQIEGFGYPDDHDKCSDPRIAELRQGRNIEEDMLVIFECTREEIAHMSSEINENTKAYVGQLEPGIFQKLPENLEHIYISFPDRKIHREKVEIGGKTAEQLITEMETAGIKITDYAKSMLKNREFVPGKNPEEVTLIRLTVADLGLYNAMTDEIYESAQILGLELCPTDTGPNYRLKYRNQPLGEWINVGMKQITDSGGRPIVFELARSGVGLWLGNSWDEPVDAWHLDSEFVFRLPKTKDKILEA